MRRINKEFKQREEYLKLNWKNACSVFNNTKRISLKKDEFIIWCEMMDGLYNLCIKEILECSGEFSPISANILAEFISKNSINGDPKWVHYPKHISENYYKFRDYKVYKEGKKFVIEKKEIKCGCLALQLAKVIMDFGVEQVSLMGTHEMNILFKYNDGSFSYDDAIEAKRMLWRHRYNISPRWFNYNKYFIPCYNTGIDIDLFNDEDILKMLEEISDFKIHSHQLRSLYSEKYTPRNDETLDFKTLREFFDKYEWEYTRKYIFHRYITKHHYSEEYFLKEYSNFILMQNGHYKLSHRWYFTDICLIPKGSIVEIGLDGYLEDTIDGIYNIAKNDYTIIINVERSISRYFRVKNVPDGTIIRVNKDITSREFSILPDGYILRVKDKDIELDAKKIGIDIETDLYYDKE